MALVDRECFRQRHGHRFDVGVAAARVEVELEARVLAAQRLFMTAELPHGHLRLEGQAVAVDDLEVGGEVGDRALIADPLRIN